MVFARNALAYGPGNAWDSSSSRGQALKYPFFYGKNSDEGQVAKKVMIQSLAPEA
jgi:hypothetical protein